MGGGVDALTAACSKAGQKHGGVVVGNGKKGSGNAGEEEINNYLKEQLSTIFQESIAIGMSSKVVEAMAQKGISSLAQAKTALGKSADKVREVELKYEAQKQRALRDMEDFKRRAKDAQVRLQHSTRACLHIISLRRRRLARACTLLPVGACACSRLVLAAAGRDSA